MKFELFIARRMRLSRGKSRSASSSVAIAVTGIALAIVVMMIALVVVLGFKHEIRDKVMGFDSQIRIEANAGYGDGRDGNYVTLSPQLEQLIDSVIPGGETTLTTQLSGILKTQDNFMGIILKGVSSGHNREFISSNIIDGNIPDYTDTENRNKVIISQTMANALQLSTGDKVYAYFFEDNNIRTRNLEIAAVYQSHFGDYDRLIAFCDISLPQKLKGLDSATGSAVEINGIAPDDIENISSSLQESLSMACYDNRLQHLYRVTNVYRTGALYFNWLDLLDTNVIVILILMACVSGFTLISSLFIIILERVNMIGLLKSLGATNRQIRSIFIYVAERLVVRGMIIGNVIALSLIMLQEKTRLLPLDPDAYYLSYVPVETNWWHIALLNIGVLAVSAVILILPSHIISTISPSRTMRYE